MFPAESVDRIDSATNLDPTIDHQLNSPYYATYNCSEHKRRDFPLINQVKCKAKYFRLFDSSPLQLYVSIDWESRHIELSLSKYWSEDKLVDFRFLLVQVRNAFGMTRVASWSDTIINKTQTKTTANARKVFWIKPGGKRK